MTSLRTEISTLRVPISTITVGVPMNKISVRRSHSTSSSQKKNSVSEEELCKGLPVEFILYLKYCKSLGFSDKPDYQYLRHLFSDLFKRLGYVDDKYDWTVLKEKGACRKDCAAI